jgi:coiled-coil domain-containing protein 151
MPRQQERQVSEAELEDLRNKFHLLEGDRKAYYEMSMHTMKSNKALVGQLREENREVRRALAAIQREHAAATKGGGLTTDQEELEDMAREVHHLRKRHDGYVSRIASHNERLNKLQAVAHTLELESKKPSEEDTPLTRKIRMLENRLDKAMIKYNEAQSIRKTYEQIVKRLKEERVGFDNQLAAIERTLAAKQHDYEELLLLSGDANHAKEIAMQELERVRNTYHDAKRLRDRDIKERSDFVNVKQEMASRMAERDRIRQEIISKAAAGVEDDETTEKMAKLAKMNEENKEEDQKEKVTVFENAFAKIKEATGVTDVNEVIQKIVSQEDTQNNLMELTKGNQSNIEKMSREYETFKLRVEELKYSGPGGGQRRKMVDDHEENLGASTTKLERTKVKYERLAKILINAKAGVDHLSEKLESVRGDRRPIQMNDETIVEVMYQCETILQDIQARCRRIQEERGVYVEETIEDRPDDVADDAVMRARPFNQRISLPDGDGLAVLEEEGDEELGQEDIEEEELTRDKIKKASSQLTTAHDRRMKKQRKGNRRK